MSYPESALPQDNPNEVTQAMRIMAAGALLQNVCHAAAFDAGWWNFMGKDIRQADPEVQKIWMGAKIALQHSELSEGLEGLRKGKMDEHLPTRPSLEVELADAVIRICDMAGGLNLDLGGAILQKLEYNAKRADHKPAARAAEGGKSF